MKDQFELGRTAMPDPCLSAGGLRQVARPRAPIVTQGRPRQGSSGAAMSFASGATRLGCNTEVLNERAVLQDSRARQPANGPGTGQAPFV